MSPLSTSSVAREPWHCSHLPHGTSCPGHTQTHTVHDRKSLYLYQFHQCLFAFTPIKPFLAASRHMLPLLNSWDADLLASVVQSNFQSVPPQRKSSLTPSSLPPSQNPSQCCRFYIESRARQHTHGRADVGIRMSGCWCSFSVCRKSPLRADRRVFLLRHRAEMGLEVDTSQDKEGFVRWDV